MPSYTGSGRNITNVLYLKSGFQTGPTWTDIEENNLLGKNERSLDLKSCASHVMKNVILVECAKIQACGMPIWNRITIPSQLKPKDTNAIGTMHRGWWIDRRDWNFTRQTRQNMMSALQVLKNKNFLSSEICLVYADLYCTKRHQSGFEMLTALPRPPSWFWGGEGNGRRGEGEGREGEGRGGDKKSVQELLCLHFKQ